MGVNQTLVSFGATAINIAGKVAVAGSAYNIYSDYQAGADINKLDVANVALELATSRFGGSIWKKAFSPIIGKFEGLASLIAPIGKQLSSALETSVAGLVEVDLEFEVGEVEARLPRPVHAEVEGGGGILEAGAQ